MITSIDPEESLLTETILIGCLVVVLLLVAYQRYRKHYSQCRLAAVRNRPVSNIEQKQIIIALELDGLFVDISSHKQEGYSKVHIEHEGVDKLVGRVKDVLGMGVYFRPKASIRTMKTLLHKLISQSRVELYLYTRLNLATADAILSELGLERHFPPLRRCSCSDLYN